MTGFHRPQAHPHPHPHPPHPPHPPDWYPMPYPYESPFLFPQSTIFASYLQSSKYPQQYPSPIPRGPPKKPKQSGHALWVGNLPPNTTLIELCSLFGTANIQSIFLIQRTLCAFVNYNSQNALYEGIAEFERRGSVIRGNQLTVKIKNSTHDEEQEPNLQDIEHAPSEDRYFVCKSLTVEDLHASVRLGVWDTQSHNQSLFNEAFMVCPSPLQLFTI